MIATSYQTPHELGRVEGQPNDVAEFIANALPHAAIGTVTPSKAGQLTLNQERVVRVTTYEPVQEPLGLPSMNFEPTENAEPLGERTPYRPINEPEQPKQKQGQSFAGAAGGATRNKAKPGKQEPLGLPAMNFDDRRSQPSGGGRSGAETGSETQNHSDAKPGRQTPLGLPSTL